MLGCVVKLPFTTSRSLSRGIRCLSGSQLVYQILRQSHGFLQLLCKVPREGRKLGRHALASIFRQLPELVRTLPWTWVGWGRVGTPKVMIKK